MDRRDFIKNMGKAGLVIALSPYLKACGTYEEPFYPQPIKSGVVLQRPIDGQIDTEATKNLILENSAIYGPNELIFDIVNESYFSFFNSEIPEIVTVDYNTEEEIKNAIGKLPPAYYEHITKTIHILQGVDNATKGINRLFHEIGHYFEHTYGNEDKKEHFAQTIEFALGLESLLLFPEIIKIEPKLYSPIYHPFFYNLPNYAKIDEFDYNQWGTNDYINGDATTILQLNKNKGNIQKTIEEILKIPTYTLDQNAVEFLEQNFNTREDLNKETFKLLIENEIDPRIPYDEQNNKYYNTIIEKIDTWIVKDYFKQFLR